MLHTLSADGDPIGEYQENEGPAEMAALEAFIDPESPSARTDPRAPGRPRPEKLPGPRPGHRLSLTQAR